MNYEPLTQIKTLEQFVEIFRKWNDQYINNIKTQLHLYHESMIQFKESQAKLSTEIESGNKMIKKFKQKLTLLSRAYKTSSTITTINTTIDENCSVSSSSSSSNSREINDTFNDNTLSHKINEMNYSIKHTVDLQNSIQLILPIYPSWFLRQCIGDINISLYWKKFNYKEQYEAFKLKSTSIFLVLWIINWIFVKLRIFDSIMHGYAMWYYSSLTIQEGILVANGSHIKCWWRFHHFMAVIAAGLMLLWPPNFTYECIRNVHYLFGCFQCIIQLIQYRYQQAQLYRINSLGSSKKMEITNEGITKQLIIGFSLTSICLFFHYCTQFYLAYQIYRLYIVHGGWQLCILLSLYNVFAFGNLITLLSVIYSKFISKSTTSVPKEDLRKALNLSLTDYYKLTKHSL